MTNGPDGNAENCQCGACPVEATSAHPLKTPASGEGRKASDPDSALRLLVEGNARFAAGASDCPDRYCLDRRRSLQAAQTPFAAVLACADSRVPVEIVFDQGLGDIFVCRVAGNILGTGGKASLDFAVAELDVPLIVVLGHESCGAITAALRVVESNVPPPPHLDPLFQHLRNPVEEALRAKPANPLQACIEANVRSLVHRLSTSEPILAPRVRAGRLKVAGAIYALSTGIVTWL